MSSAVRPEDAGDSSTGGRGRMAQCASSNSTSNFSVAFGGITPPAPRAP
jgi:hypothetical protein